LKHKGNQIKRERRRGSTHRSGGACTGEEIHPSIKGLVIIPRAGPAMEKGDGQEPRKKRGKERISQSSGKVHAELPPHREASYEGGRA